MIDVIERNLKKDDNDAQLRKERNKWQRCGKKETGRK